MDEPESRDDYIFSLLSDDSEESDPDYDPALEEDPNDERDDAAASLSDDESLPDEPIQRANTRYLRSALEGVDVRDKVVKILAFMRDQGMDLPLFLDAVSWGNKSCHSDRKIQYARTGLLVSEELPRILKRWYRPPLSTGERKGARPRGARKILNEFAVECVNNEIDREMMISAHLFLSPPADLNEKNLLSTQFEGVTKELRSIAPFTWNLFHRAACSQEQERLRVAKDFDAGTLNRIAQCQYSRSRRRGRFQKLWGLYLKACGLSARAFDAVHSLGITMSHKWTSNAYTVLSARAIERTRRDVLRKVWIISHDNLNVPLRVFSQRLNNQSHFVNATAGTVWVLPESARLPSNINKFYQAHRSAQSQTMFSVSDLMYGDENADLRIEAQHKFRLLRILLDCPEFSDYEHKDHPALCLPPLPTEQLPSGPENITEQHILGTCEIEEASYEGTLKVMEEWFKQLGLDTDDEHRRTGLERLIVWLGDQLTVERLRGLWKYRHDDHNSFDRLDYMIPMFGWFHLVMAFANSLHKQYLATSAGVGGLRHAFDLLKRKGLITQSTKGPFWHDLDEAIKHISEAHFLASWLAVAGVKNLLELKAKSPQELISLRDLVFEQQCSRSGLVQMKTISPDMQDQVLIQSVMWNMDVLPYLELRDAIKVGDVGRMSDLIPVLLFRFVGGGNSKYAIEMLELLQGLRREWPDSLKAYIKKWCWLMNRTGKQDGFLPFDLGQEENVCDIKVNYRSMGPGATMSYVKKVSPAIPTLRKVQRHVEGQTGTLTRGAAHGTPDKDKDVCLLTQQYQHSAVHQYAPGRKLKSASDKASDFVEEGATKVAEGSMLADWWQRRTMPRATGERWEMDED